MRKALFLSLLLATTACSQDGDETRQTSQDLKTYDSSEEAAVDSDASAPPAAPGISPTAAPGVAFNYRYAFRLPAERIASVQEQHAAACEKLGLARCRIAGMRYRLVNDRDIEAMLAFKLDPAIARAFGKQGIDAVSAADGMLVDSEITGEDVGSRIEESGRSIAQMEEELAGIERQLAAGGQRSAERAELQAQAQRLREAIRAARADREDRRETLAKTPMVFSYGSGDLAPGFDDRPKVGEVIEDAADNFLDALAWIFVAFVTLLPWALLIALGIWAWRLVARRLPRRPAEEPLTRPEE